MRPHSCEHCYGHIVPSHIVSSTGNLKCAIHQFACLVIRNSVPWHIICCVCWLVGNRGHLLGLSASAQVNVASFGVGAISFHIC